MKTTTELEPSPIAGSDRPASHQYAITADHRLPDWSVASDSDIDWPLSIAAHSAPPGDDQDWIQRDDRCGLVILQPRGCLDAAHGAVLAQALEQILRSAPTAVMLDLMWIDAIDAAALTMLQAAAQLAKTLAVSLAFASVDWHTRQALEAALNRQQTVYTGSWSSTCRPDFQNFLSQTFRHRPLAYINANVLHAPTHCRPVTKLDVTEIDAAEIAADHWASMGQSMTTDQYFASGMG